jgi:hypothetical protein
MISYGVLRTTNQFSGGFIRTSCSDDTSLHCSTGVVGRAYIATVARINPNIVAGQRLLDRFPKLHKQVMARRHSHG